VVQNFVPPQKHKEKPNQCGIATSMITLAAYADPERRRIGALEGSFQLPELARQVLRARPRKDPFLAIVDHLASWPDDHLEESPAQAGPKWWPCHSTGPVTYVAGLDASLSRRVT
jgi:hypothetical protein